MSLLSDSFDKFNFIEKKFVPDGEGGINPTWTVGAEFLATADFSTSSTATIADKLTERVNCTITTTKSITLEPMDVIQRQSDGTYFRILSNGANSKTPDSAALDMRQSKAEIWSLPT